MARPMIPSDALRERLDIYVAPAERSVIAAKAGCAGLGLSTFVRRAALAQRVAAAPVIPAQQWAALSKAAANLNQIAHAINSGRANGVPPGAIEDLTDLLRAVRISLTNQESGRAS